MVWMQWLHAVIPSQACACIDVHVRMLSLVVPCVMRTMQAFACTHTYKQAHLWTCALHVLLLRTFAHG